MPDVDLPDDLEPDDEDVEYPDEFEEEPTEVPGPIGWLPEDDDDDEVED